jgi:hypothetical protein
VALAALGALVALGASTASARVNVAIGLGFPGIVAPAPYYSPYYAPPVVAVAPPSYYYPPSGYYAAPVATYAPGYWWVDRWGHRHWRRR